MSTVDLAGLPKTAALPKTSNRQFAPQPSSREHMRSSGPHAIKLLGEKVAARFARLASAGESVSFRNNKSESAKSPSFRHNEKVSIHKRGGTGTGAILKTPRQIEAIKVPEYAVDLSSINLEALPGANATSESKQSPPPLPPPIETGTTMITMGHPITRSQRAYRYDIDGLRTVAVLAVVLFHTDGRWLPGGFVGVDIFFVISGYVVAGSLLRKPAPSLGPYLAAFYSRRVKRLTPALALVVLASSLALACLVPPTEHSVSEFMVSGIISLFGGANMYFAVVAPSSQGVTADGHAVDDRPPSPPTTPPSPPSPAAPRPPTSPPPPRCVDLT